MYRTSAKKSGGRPTNRPKTKEEISRLLELYGTHTAGEVAEVYGVSPSAVRVWIYNIRRHGTTAYIGDGERALEERIRRLEELNTERKAAAGEDDEE